MKSWLSRLGSWLRNRSSGKNEEGQEIATDEEGHLLDDSAKATRAAARAVLAGKTGLMQQLHAVRSMDLDDASLQKLFGRQEGLMAYKLLLRNEGEFNEAKTSIGGAAGKDLVGRVLALPGSDAQAAAAKTARTAENEAEVTLAGSQIGAKQNIIDAVYKQAEADYASGKLKPGWGFSAESQIAQLETIRKGEGILPAATWAKELVEKKKVLDAHPALYRQYVESQGGEQAVFGGRQNWHGGQDTAALDHYREVTKDLKDSAAALKNSAQRPRPTLVAPNVDR